MDSIEKIYHRSIQPSEKSMRGDKEYCRAKGNVTHYYKRLCEKLSQEEIGIINKLMSNYDIKIQRKNAHCFVEGFKQGFEIAVKSLNK